jgi:cytochrome c oxidase subunit I
MAYFDYSNPAIAPEAWTVVSGVIGGALLVLSGILFIYILLRGHRAAPAPLPEYTFSIPVHAVTAVPKILNTFGIWVALMIALTIVNYGFPIAHLMSLKTSVPAISVAR